MAELGVARVLWIPLLYSRGVCEWVSSFLTAHKHILGYSVLES